jgi:hypothetical protein
MQRFLGLILALGLSISAFAQGNGPTFTVQIGTFVDSKSSDFDGIRSFGFLYATPLGGNMSRIYMGGYNSFDTAEAVAQQARQRGYIDASVVELNPASGQTVTVIQLGVKEATQPIDWSRYQEAGSLYVLLNNQQVKIVSGIFPSIDAAKESLRIIRSKGFDDAFIKNVNSVLLHEVDAFVLGTPEVADIPQEYSYDPPAPVTTSPEVYVEPIPESYDVPATIPKGPPAPPRELIVDQPAIRSNVKRTSALDLQRLLKKEGAYKSSLDGYYGRGTTAAYQQIFDNHPTLQKYRYLAEDRSFSGTENASTLQRHINNIPYDPQAANNGLSGFSEPIAKAYRAYLLFVNGQTGMPVNSLMNEAIQQAFSNGGPNPVPGFDYTAAYAYNNLDQLILHLRYVHAATDDAAVPCWLFQRHPEEAIRAFEPGESMSSANYRVEACGGFAQWEEVRVLLTIAQDMNANAGVNPEELAAGNSRETRYLLAPKPLTEQEDKTVNAWHSKLQQNLALWAIQDPMLEEVYTAFGVAYFQTQVLLEDYYMDKGLNSGQAKGLALATLKSMVGPYVGRFM